MTRAVMEKKQKIASKHASFLQENSAQFACDQTQQRLATAAEDDAPMQHAASAARFSNLYSCNQSKG